MPKLDGAGGGKVQYDFFSVPNWDIGDTEGFSGLRSTAHLSIFFYEGTELVSFFFKL